MSTMLRTRATIGLNTGAIACLVTTYWDSTGAGLAAMATESVARVRAAFAALAPSIATGTTFTPNLIVDEVDENTGAIVNQVAAAAPAATSGGLAATALPAQTMLVAQYLTSSFIGGRRVRGRSYLPGFTINAVVGGGLPSAGALAGVGLWNAALGATVVTAMNQRVWHRPSPLTGTGGLSVVVTARAVNPAFAVLRSRRK